MTALSFPSLADEVVVLRPWTADDVPAMLAAFDDPLFQQFSDWQPRTAEQARRHLAEHERARERGESIDFALAPPDGLGTVLGGASLNDVHPTSGRASVGYWLAPHARGRGVATHAVRLVAGWAFDELGLVRLELTCGPDNGASQRVAARCGFTRERVLRAQLAFKGGRRDTVVFGLSRC